MYYFIANTNLLGTEEGQEHVKSDLDSVEEDKTMLGRNVLEVNEVHERPDLP